MSGLPDQAGTAAVLTRCCRWSSKSRGRSFRNRRCGGGGAALDIERSDGHRTRLALHRQRTVLLAEVVADDGARPLATLGGESSDARRVTGATVRCGAGGRTGRPLGAVVPLKDGTQPLAVGRLVGRLRLAGAALPGGALCLSTFGALAAGGGGVAEDTAAPVAPLGPVVYWCWCWCWL